MSSSTRMPDLRPTAVDAAVDDSHLRVTLADGRELKVPIAWFRWLDGATREQLLDFEIIEGGQGIWWDSVDEGVSVPGLLGLPHH